MTYSGYGTEHRDYGLPMPDNRFVVGTNADAVVTYFADDADTSVWTTSSNSALTGGKTVESRHGIDHVLHDPSGVATNSYDAFGRCVRTAKGYVIKEYAYDSVGALIAMRTLTVTNALAETYSYDMLGQKVEVKDALGQSTYTSYDEVGNAVAEWGATYPVHYEYDTAGRRTLLATTRDGVVWDETRWTYDPATGLCLSKTYADGSVAHYTHTTDGLPFRTTYASGRWMENEYDTRRRLVGVRYDDSNDVSYGRDTYGRETVMSNAVASYVYARECSGIATNEVMEIGGTSRTLRRVVDGQGRLNGLAVSETGYEQHFAYTSDNLVEVISNTDAVVAYTYSTDRNETGCVLSLTNGTTLVRSVTRDPSRRELVTEVTTTVNGNAVESFGYAYDADGRPVARNADGFGYNVRGEVASATVNGALFAYRYDEIGNSTNWMANCLNQYTHCTYDADGNMTQCGPWTYVYDSMNRLETVSSNGVLLVTNSYDAKSRRIRKVTAEATTTFFYDDWNLVEEQIAYANGIFSTIRYYWGKDLSETLQGSGGVGGLLYLTMDSAIYIPCYDNNGNITRYLDASGATVARYVYDAFGRTIFQTGPLAEVFRHRFSSKCYDEETRLYYYGRRFYRPVFMRWLNRDPIEEDGGNNIYAFCGNNAICNCDKEGCAYFAIRKLSYAPSIIKWSNFFRCPFWGIIADFAADYYNVEIAHEQLFYEDGGSPSSIGWSSKGYLRDESPAGYYRRGRSYNDCIMRIAESRVKPTHYQLTWFGNRTKCNCQDYADALRAVYHSIENDIDVKCQCKGSR